MQYIFPFVDNQLKLVLSFLFQNPGGSGIERPNSVEEGDEVGVPQPQQTISAEETRMKEVR